MVPRCTHAQRCDRGRWVSATRATCEMRINARSRIVAFLALLGLLSSGCTALAEDYSVDFGIETDAGKDAGTLACKFGQTCDATMDTLGLRVTILVFRDTPEQVTVRMAATSVAAILSTPLTPQPLIPANRCLACRSSEGPRPGVAYMLRINTRARST